ncbi:hypothetical protein SKAU_G00416980 [Synaphobranchus kaupii]|uniref:Ig-like domain-containing protein n=1 Tax=Synaphobranchus kaupii TaxID=118154 RepID=A0A9Q1E5V0_SYNKA|nr:hypothetical protein SKAU_G00416980 [Synaphobranchus kaupii]
MRTLALWWYALFSHDSPASPSLSVSGELKAGKAVIASCSVSHSCPSGLPHLTWNHTGTLIVQSEQLTNGQWRVTSSLTFTAANSDHNKRLICTAEYQNNIKTVQSSTILNVRYPPRIGEGSVCTATITGVDCQCLVESWPTSRVQWVLADGTIVNGSSVSSTDGKEPRAVHTLHLALGFTDMVACHASNTHGNEKLDLKTNQSGILMAIYVSGSAASVFMLVLVILVPWKCSRRKRW